MDPQYIHKVIFQQAIQQAKYLNIKPCSETKPYQYKYQAKDVLKRLIFQIPQQGPLFKAHLMLGNICIQTQQATQGFKHLKDALRVATKLQQPQNHLIDLLQLYNLYGFALVGRDQNQLGLSVLGKAQQAYQAIIDICPQPKIYDWYGGGSKQQAQQLYTLTLFYMAQTYTKLGLKDNAALYCGRTLQRQYSSGKFQRHQFITDLLGLTDYYNQIKFFGQSLYIVKLAFNLLQSKDNEQIKGKVYLAHSRVLSAFLQFGCQTLRGQGFQEDDQRIVNKLVIQFEGIKIDKQTLMLPKDIQDLKGIFRQALAKYRKVLQIFPLDGFVTDHIQTVLQINQLYTHLSLVQTKRQRQLAMLDKKRQNLQGILPLLNPKAYISTCQKMTADIYSISKQNFQIRHQALFSSDDQQLSQNQSKKVNEMNKQGIKAIEMARKLINNAQLHQQTKNQKYWEWIFDLKMSIAKIQSKIFAYNKNQRVEYLKQSLDTYRQCQQLITQAQKKEPGILTHQQAAIRQMLMLLPTKIDRINYK